jgi:hypothetical protein
MIAPELVVTYIYIEFEGYRALGGFLNPAIAIDKVLARGGQELPPFNEEHHSTTVKDW